MTTTAPVSSPKLRRPVCRYCGGPVMGERALAYFTKEDGSNADRFCSKEHKTAQRNLDLKRGAKLMPVAMKWRKSRGTIKGSFHEMTFIMDGFAHEDRERLARFKREREAAAKAAPKAAAPAPVVKVETAPAVEEPVSVAA